MSTIDSRQEWLRTLEQLYAASSTPVSNLPCLEHCPDCLCERKHSEKVFFLPFEMEFIGSRINKDLESLGAFWTLDIPIELNGVRQIVPIGIKSKHQPCPFLDSDNHCTIHAHRPFDCRSFPVMPVFEDRDLKFELEPYCPLVQHFGQSLLRDFINLYQELWHSISNRLPTIWKWLYWHSSEAIPELDDMDVGPSHIILEERP